MASKDGFPCDASLFDTETAKGRGVVYFSKKYYWNSVHMMNFVNVIQSEIRECVESKFRRLVDESGTEALNQWCSHNNSARVM